MVFDCTKMFFIRCSYYGLSSVWVKREATVHSNELFESRNTRANGICRPDKMKPARDCPFVDVEAAVEDEDVEDEDDMDHGTSAEI
jgi:hypothetical protein